MDTEPGRGSCFTFYVKADTNPNDSTNMQMTNVNNELLLLPGQTSITPELPSDFSFLIGRMQAIYKQF